MISPSRLSYDAHQAHLGDIRRHTAERPAGPRAPKTTIRARFAALLQRPTAPASAQFQGRPARVSH